MTYGNKPVYLYEIECDDGKIINGIPYRHLTNCDVCEEPKNKDKKSVHQIIDEMHSRLVKLGLK